MALNTDSGTMRMHQPGCVRPARPSRCRHADRAHHCAVILQRPIWLGSPTLVLWMQKSMTPITSGRVRDDSAMVVASTTLQICAGGFCRTSS